MFELTTGTIDRPFQDGHAAASIFSAGAHVVVLGSLALAFAIGASDTLPKVPTMIAFVAEAPVPSPPPPPPASPRVRAEKSAEPAKPAPTSGSTFIAPADAPRGIQPEPLSLGDDDGETGGVPGGVLGGVPGGIVMNRADTPPPPPPPLPRVPKRVGGDVHAPALIHRVEPEYPPIAVVAKKSGMVILEATVNEKGEVTEVTVLRSIPLLDKAAIEAVKQWRYEPLLLNGAPMPFILTVTLTFAFR